MDSASSSDSRISSFWMLVVTSGASVVICRMDSASSSDSRISSFWITTGTTIYTTTNDLRSTSSEIVYSRTTYSTDPIDHTINTRNDLSSSTTQSTASVTSCMCACDQLGNEALVDLTSEDIKQKVNELVEKFS
jgi:cytolysin (calcineurin-like family phosphatase)